MNKISINFLVMLTIFGSMGNALAKSYSKYQSYTPEVRQVLEDTDQALDVMRYGANNGLSAEEQVAWADYELNRLKEERKSYSSSYTPSYSSSSSYTPSYSSSSSYTPSNYKSSVASQIEADEAYARKLQQEYDDEEYARTLQHEEYENYYNNY